MKTIVATVLMSFILTVNSGYSQTFEWANNIGSPSGEYSESIDRDAAGNVYVTGFFFETITLGNLTLTGSRDMFLAKYNSIGEIQWAVNSTGTGLKRVFHLVCDNAGNSYVTGFYTGSATFGWQVFNSPNDIYKIFVAKYNSSGIFVWAKSIDAGPITDADLSPLALKISVDDNLNFFVAGVFSNNISFGSINLTSNGWNDIFLAKYLPDGTLDWAVSGGSNSPDRCSGIAIDISGNVFLTGDIYGPANFSGVTLNPYPNTRFYIKYNSTGSIVFSKMVSETSVMGFGMDDLSNSYLLISYNKISKFDASCNLEWSKTWSGYVSPRKLHTDAIGNSYVCGSFTGTASFPPYSIVSVGNHDFFVAKYDPDGNMEWVTSAGGIAMDIAYGITSDLAGNAYVSGSYSDQPITFGNITLNCNGLNDAFVAKISGGANLISGKVFLDNYVHDGIFDPNNEPIISGILISPTTGAPVVPSDASGDYYSFCGQNIQSVSILYPPLYYTPSPDSKTFDFGTSVGATISDANLGLYPTPNINDLRITLTDLTRARPGFKAAHLITYKNVGTTTIPLAKISLTFDANLTLPLCSPVPLNSSGNPLEWEFTNLDPYESGTIYIEYTLPGTVALQTVLTSTATISPIAGDFAPTDNTSILNQVVTGSYDPNDKSVEPAGNLSLQNIQNEDPLTYTIRFQNTGTDTAFTVKVTDTLSPKLNIATTETISSSHAYTFNIKNGNILVWTFSNILLPDSNTNKIGSNGFIKYKIKPKNNLLAGDEINNSANIYFDFNQPVITNTTNTKVSASILTEHIVPQYFGSKSASSTNNSRTPFAVCLQITGLQPNTLYDVQIGIGLISDPPTAYGAGNVWNKNSNAFTGQRDPAAFTTDPNGDSKPFWSFIQPTGNSARFSPGQVHNLRVGFTPSGGTFSSDPDFVGSKQITALDIPVTELTPSTTDNGAFIKGEGFAAESGKYFLLYENTAGTGNPLSSYQIRTTFATNTSQSELPAAINDVYLQAGTSLVGDFAAVVPIGANNQNGIRRIEIRNSDNTILNYFTDDDGIWINGTNTTTLARREVGILLNESSISSIDFAPKVDFASGINPISVSISDLDGDSKSDIAVANLNDNTVSIFRNTSVSGNVSFAPKVDLITGANPRCVSTGDIDGDGKPDLAVANINSNTVSVFRNTSVPGTVSFAAKVDFVTGANPRTVSIGDIDGDGKPDLAVANTGSNSVSVLRNTSVSGTVSFAAKVDFLTGNYAHSVSIGDINSDGKPDLAVVNYYSNTVSVLRNTSASGTISFAAKIDFITGTYPYDVKIGDLDGDTKPDLAVTNNDNSSNSISVFRNTSVSESIGFDAKVDFATGAEPNNLSIRDLDGDGKPELSVSNTNSNTVSVFSNTSSSGTISFSAKKDFATGVNPYSVCIGDLDGDNKLDMATANRGSDNVSVLKNIGSFTVSNFTLNLKLLLQGRYNSELNKMVPDTVKVYLRNSASPLLTADSSLSVIDLNGTGTFTFLNDILNETPYYIVVKHRNSIETWSASPVTFTNGAADYDFTASLSQAFGNNMILTGGKPCIYSGDVNQSGSVDLSDVIQIYNAASSFASGYAVTDLTGDSVVDLSDLIIANNNASIFVTVRKP